MRKILILRPDNIGDVVLFLGCLRHYREIFNKERITLIVREKAIELVKACPYVDEILPYENFLPLPKNKLFDFLNARILRRKLKGYKWDAVICPVRSPTENMLRFVEYTGANQTSGIVGCRANLSNSKWKPENFFSDFMHLSEEDLQRHELETNRLFLEFLGRKKLHDMDIWPEFWTSVDDRLFAETSMMANKQVITAGLVIYADAVYREYPEKNYGRIFVNLPHIKRVVLFGYINKKKRYQEIERCIVHIKKERSDIDIVNLVNKTTLAQFIECVKRCNLLISVETGLLHIATAMKLPTVGILGGGFWGRFYPWGDLNINRVVNKNMKCYYCKWQCIFNDFRCIKDISISSVAEECNTLLKKTGGT